MRRFRNYVDMYEHVKNMTPEQRKKYEEYYKLLLSLGLV